jgi:hypothetical protein
MGGAEMAGGGQGCSTHDADSVALPQPLKHVDDLRWGRLGWDGQGAVHVEEDERVSWHLSSAQLHTAPSRACC